MKANGNHFNRLVENAASRIIAVHSWEASSSELVTKDLQGHLYCTKIISNGMYRVSL